MKVTLSNECPTSTIDFLPTKIKLSEFKSEGTTTDYHLSVVLHGEYSLGNFCDFIEVTQHIEDKEERTELTLGIEVKKVLSVNIDPDEETLERIKSIALNSDGDIVVGSPSGIVTSFEYEDMDMEALGEWSAVLEVE